VQAGVLLRRRGRPARGGGDGVRPFDAETYLGFDPEGIESVLAGAVGAAEELAEIEERRTVYVDPELDEDAFFSTDEGHTTLVNRYDLEKTVPMDEKRHFVEVERYWVDKPYAFVVIFRSVRENEKKYYVVGPYLTEIESDLVEYFSGKLRTSRRTALTGRGEGDEPRHPADDRRFVASESKTRP
jgi:flagellar protein FlaI